MASTTLECRHSAGVCDIAEKCNGLSKSCPADGVASTTVECRPSAGTCDIAEKCDGFNKSCPADILAAGGTVCRASEGDCDVAESCTGTTAECPSDAVATNSVECRPSAGSCDVAEQCDGFNKSCPGDEFSNGTVCRQADGICDVAESCNGTGVECPADSVKQSGFVCRDSVFDLDIAETCDGTKKSCPEDNVKKFSIGEVTSTANENGAVYEGDITVDGETEGRIKITVSDFSILSKSFLDLSVENEGFSVEVIMNSNPYIAYEGEVNVSDGNIFMGFGHFSITGLKLKDDSGNILISSQDIEVDKRDGGSVTPGDCAGFSYNAEYTAKWENSYFAVYKNYDISHQDGTKLIMSVEFHGEKAGYIARRKYDLGKGMNSRENCKSGGICFYFVTDKDNDGSADGGIGEDRYFPEEGELRILYGDVFSGKSEVVVENLTLQKYSLNESYKWEPVEGDCLQHDFLAWNTTGIVNPNPEICEAGEKSECYNGPYGTAGVGKCAAGTKTCDENGHWGYCKGEKWPDEEDMLNGIDDDCDGVVDRIAPEIRSIQNGEIAEGSEFMLSDVVVISPVKEYFYDTEKFYSFYVSEKDGNSGIFVYKVQGDVVPARGDVVTIAAIVNSHEGNYMLKGKVISKTGTAEIPAPLNITKADLNVSHKGRIVKMTTNLVVRELPCAENHYLLRFEGEHDFDVANSYAHDATANLSVGDVVATITGIYDYTYNTHTIFVLENDAIVKE